MNQNVMEHQQEERLKEIEDRIEALEQTVKELKRQLEIDTKMPFALEVG